MVEAFFVWLDLEMSIRTYIDAQSKANEYKHTPERAKRDRRVFIIKIGCAT